MFFGIGILFGSVLVMIMHTFLPIHVPLVYGNLLLAVSTFFVAPVTNKGSIESSVAALYVTGICNPLTFVSGLPVAYAALKDRFVG